MNKQNKSSNNINQNNDFIKDIIKEITELTEKELQLKIVEPLLLSQGFEHVRDTSGPIEKGRDLVAIKSEIGRSKLYAIQLKKYKFSGKQTNTNSFTHLRSQLIQAALEPVTDPLASECRPPDRLIFITPFAINVYVLNNNLAQFQDLEQRDITIIDGPILVSEAIKHIPCVLEGLSNEVRYRTAVTKTMSYVKESSAFGIGELIDLNSIYVDLSVENKSPGVDYAIRQTVKPRKWQRIKNISDIEIVKAKKIAKKYKATIKVKRTKGTDYDILFDKVTIAAQKSLRDPVSRIQKRAESENIPFKVNNDPFRDLVSAIGRYRELEQ